MIYLYLFVMGSIMGSFYLVLATRGSLEKSIISPRSHCDNCNQKLQWFLLIPILSYLFTGGKCYYCKKNISILNPLVEIITGLSFMLAYYLFGISYLFWASLIVFSLLIIIFISDFKYYIILDSPLVISSIAILLLKYYYFGPKTSLKALICGFIMFGIVYLIKKFGDFLFKKESLGGGDIKLSFFLGVLLGLRLSLVSFILSSFLALPYALASAYLSQKKEVPFGPFIIFSATLIFIYMDKFTNLLNFFFSI